MTLNDGIKSFQKAIDGLVEQVDDPLLNQKLKAFTDADEDVKNAIRQEAVDEDVDLVVSLLRSELLPGELTTDQVGKVFNAYVAWNHAVENVDQEMQQGAQWFAHMKQLLKLYTRQRDKAMMLSIVEEPVTLQLFRDLFTIFYEPLVRVYKSANVYTSITDFAQFADDAISVVEKYQRQDVSADPNQTVQAFIDLCARHEDKFYKFIHEVHIHDNGLFSSLMTWIEGILEFLRKGPRGGKLDMNALFQGAMAVNQIDKDKGLQEINSLIQWHEDRKRWHLNKTRQKMAAEGTGGDAFRTPSFKGSDFGLDEVCLIIFGYLTYLTNTSRPISMTSPFPTPAQTPLTKSPKTTISTPLPPSEDGEARSRTGCEEQPGSPLSLIRRKSTSWGNHLGPCCDLFLLIN